ncbi:DUF6586 family protein [Kineobactrum salinum]|uniref:PasA protein n=1 Tax=Kineobactrum salinum TaxID=2708301 RepID=A0A6C0U9K1_9GAMM|nr:DUF6586 family protein [Kineobactrum salinum]QIB67345.1 hypothetical protein G3T16_20040 [Kineobactrum salinum]
MSSARGRANHSLYLARLLLAAWERELGREDTPATVLAQAWAPAVRNHLLDAYGWFLLELLKPAEMPASLPVSVAQLPAAEPGKAVPAEVAEFEQLEQQGWLAEMLQAPVSQAVHRGSDSLASSVDGLPTPVTMAAWAEQLDRAFARMGDLLDEC